MKKIQCEVCGGNEIKKISDDVFECQSCGIQYSASDVQKILVELTGEVKIDHSSEAENMVKRAKQFEDNGDFEKAQEYYDKALDYDPDNENILQAKYNSFNSSNPKYIFESDITSEQATKNLFNYLYTRDKLIPDFFSQFEIVSSYEKYYPIIMFNNKITGVFSGTACYKHQVPYTDYEEKSVRMSNGTYIKERVPVTKYREEIDKRPTNGNFSTTAAEIYSVSDELNSAITDCLPSRVDEIVAKDMVTDKGYIGAMIYKEFEKEAKEVIIENVNSFIEVNHKNLRADENGSYYGELSIDILSEPNGWINRAKSNFSKYTEKCCASAAYNVCPGDYSEDIQYTIETSNETVSTIYIPIQVVKYKYNDSFYVSIQILNSLCNKIACSYPKDAKSAEIDERNKKESDEINKWSAAGIIAVITGIVGAFLAILSSSNESLVVVSIILLLFITLPLGIVQSKKTKAKRESLNSTKVELAQNNRKNEAILKPSFKAFIDCYEQKQDVKLAVESSRNLIADNDIYSIEHEYGYSDYCVSSNINFASSSLQTEEKKGKVFISIGKRSTPTSRVHIYIDKEKVGDIISKESVSYSIEKDCLIDFKWNNAFSKISIPVFADQTKIIHIEYGFSNLIIEEKDEDDRFDSLIIQNDIDTAMQSICSEYGENQEWAKAFVDNRKVKLGL